MLAEGETRFVPAVEAVLRRGIFTVVQSFPVPILSSNWKQIEMKYLKKCKNKI